MLVRSADFGPGVEIVFHNFPSNVDERRRRLAPSAAQATLRWADVLQALPAQRRRQREWTPNSTVRPECGRWRNVFPWCIVCTVIDGSAGRLPPTTLSAPAGLAVRYHGPEVALSIESNARLYARFGPSFAEETATHKTGGIQAA